MRDNISSYNTRRGLSMLLVIALHIVTFYAFISATDFVFIPASLKVLQVKFFHVDPPKDEVPPPTASSIYPEALVIQTILPDIRVQPPIASSPVQDIKQKIADAGPPASPAEPAGLIVPPVRISKAHKSEMYPGKSVKNRESGRTELRVCISASGIVDNAEV